MKITKQRLKEIIKEELNEGFGDDPPRSPSSMARQDEPGEKYDPYPAHWYSIGRKELLAFIDNLKSLVGPNPGSADTPPLQRIEPRYADELAGALERIMVKFPEEPPCRPPPRD